MKIWTITTQQDGEGTETAVYTTEAAAVGQYARIVAASWESWFGESGDPMPDDTAQAWKILTSEAGFLDDVSITAHEIELPLPDDVAGRVVHLRHVFGENDADAELIEALAEQLALARECIANLEDMQARDEAALDAEKLHGAAAFWNGWDAAIGAGMKLTPEGVAAFVSRLRDYAQTGAHMPHVHDQSAEIIEAMAAQIGEMDMIDQAWSARVSAIIEGHKAKILDLIRQAADAAGEDAVARLLRHEPEASPLKQQFLRQAARRPVMAVLGAGDEAQRMVSPAQTVAPGSVAVCPICDIAGCRHIRARGDA